MGLGKGFPGDSLVKSMLAKQDTQVRSLGWEDPVEKEMATHSSILALGIPWTKEPGRLQSTGSQRVGHDWVTSLHFTQLLAFIKAYISSKKMFLKTCILL